MPAKLEMTVVDHAAFGEIVKGWAKDPAKRPRTIKDLKAVVHPQIMEISAGYADDAMIEYLTAPSSQVRPSFFIPHADDIGTPLPEGAYPLPNYYRDKAFYPKEPNIAFGKTPEEAAARAEVFRSCRIGDYAAAKCM
jgi:hypothetical protein